MARGKMTLHIVNLLSLLLIGKCSSASRSTVFDEILDSLKNIENLIRESSQPALFLDPSVGRNGIVHSSPVMRPRDVTMNVDPFQSHGVREHLHRHPHLTRSSLWGFSRLSNDRSVISNTNANDLVGHNYDDLESLRKKSIITERPKNGNVNSNFNQNVNSDETNLADMVVRRKLPERNSESMYGGSGVESPSNRGQDINRNTNVNTNTNVMKNKIKSLEDDDDDDDDDDDV